MLLSECSIGVKESCWLKLKHTYVAAYILQVYVTKALDRQGRLLTDSGTYAPSLSLLQVKDHASMTPINRISLQCETCIGSMSPAMVPPYTAVLWSDRKVLKTAKIAKKGKVGLEWIPDYWLIICYTKYPHSIIVCGTCTCDHERSQKDLSRTILEGKEDGKRLG